MQTLDSEPVVQVAEESAKPKGFWNTLTDILEEYGPYIRAGSVANNIVVCSLNINFVTAIPRCCGDKETTLFVNTMYLMSFALLTAALNAAHLYRNWPKSTITHFVLSGITETFIGAYVIARVTAGLIDTSSAVLIVVGFVIDCVSHPYALKRVKDKREKRFECCFESALLTVVLLYSLVVCILAIVSLSATHTSIYFNTDAYDNNKITGGSWRWYDSTEERELKHNCTLSYDLSHDYTATNGGTVEEYCVLKDWPESDYRGQCCVWYYDDN